MPNDYRVTWTKADEEYASWTDASKNASTTSTTLIITGLEGGRGVQGSGSNSLRWPFGRLEREPGYGSVAGISGDGASGHRGRSTSRQHLH